MLSGLLELWQGLLHGLDCGDEAAFVKGLLVGLGVLLQDAVAIAREEAEPTNGDRHAQASSALGGPRRDRFTRRIGITSAYRLLQARHAGLRLRSGLQCQ